mgnify:CR=1 FL=1
MKVGDAWNVRRIEGMPLRLRREGLFTSVGEPRVVGDALLPADQIEREIITAVTCPDRHTVVLGGLLMAAGHLTMTVENDVVFFVALAGLFWYVLGQMNEGEYNPREVPTQFIGREAPRFELPDLFAMDQRVRSSDMAGQVWLLNVWGTWCPECWREHDFLLYLAKQEQFPIVGIDWRDDANEARRFLQQKGNPFIAVGVDTESKAIMDLGVYGAPETFLIDSEGFIRKKHKGAMTKQIWQDEFRPLIDELEKG